MWGEVNVRILGIVSIEVIVAVVGSSSCLNLCLFVVEIDVNRLHITSFHPSPRSSGGEVLGVTGLLTNRDKLHL